jgi:hypothetical protein
MKVLSPNALFCEKLSKYMNKKSGNIYIVVSDDAICKTDKFDGDELVVYIREGIENQNEVYVKSKSEFMNKFEFLF